jgi:hypothetical protein
LGCVEEDLGPFQRIYVPVTAVVFFEFGKALPGLNMPGFRIGCFVKEPRGVNGKGYHASSVPHGGVMAIGKFAFFDFFPDLVGVGFEAWHHDGHDNAIGTKIEFLEGWKVVFMVKSVSGEI